MAAAAAAAGGGGDAARFIHTAAWFRRSASTSVNTPDRYVYRALARLPLIRGPVNRHRSRSAGRSQSHAVYPHVLLSLPDSIALAPATQHRSPCNRGIAVHRSDTERAAMFFVRPTCRTSTDTCIPPVANGMSAQRESATIACKAPTRGHTNHFAGGVAPLQFTLPQFFRVVGTCFRNSTFTFSREMNTFSS